MPGVVEDHARVGVVRQEDLQHLRQHLRPEVGQRRVDLDQPQGQHVGTVGFRHLKQEGKVRFRWMIAYYDMIWQFFRVSHLLVAWVFFDKDFECSTVCPILMGLMGI